MNIMERLHNELRMFMQKVMCVVIMSILSVQAQLVIPQMKHRLLLADEGNQKIHYVNLLDTTKNWSVSVSSNRDMQLVGDNKLMVSNGSGYEEYDLLTHQQTKKVAIGSQIQSTFRISDQETYVGIDGTVPKISIINVASGLSKSAISIQPSVTLRIIRATTKKTFLIGGKDAGMVCEVDSMGKKIWEANVGGSPYQAVRMPSGNTIISTGYGAQIAVVDKNAKILRKFPENPKDAALTSVKPNFFGGFQVLDNGNIVVTNWQGHGSGFGASGVQLLEFDSTGVIVGGWKQNASYISSLHGVIVLDNLDTKKLNSDVNGILGPVESVHINNRNSFNVVHSEFPIAVSHREYTVSGKVLSKPLFNKSSTVTVIPLSNKSIIRTTCHD
jgi:hypothetical protein